MLRKFSTIFFENSAFFLSISSFVYMLYFLSISAKYICNGQVCDLSIISTYFHDFVYHGAIASSAFKTWAFRMPIFAGQPMQGYHYLYNALLSILIFLGIPLVNAYWYVGPVLYFVVIMFLLKNFAKRYSRDTVFLSLLYFFYFFGGTLSFIATLIFKKTLFGYGVSSLLHTSTIFLYPTVALSMIFVFFIWIKLFGGNQIGVWQIGVVLFLLMGTKFYAGATMLVVVFVNEVFRYFGVHRVGVKKTLMNLSLYTTFCFAALVIFYNFPQSLKKEPVFGWAPLAAVHQIIEDEYAYPLKNISMARDTLYSMGGFSPRLIAIESGSVVLFVIHHFGTRILGFLYLLWLIFKKKSSPVDLAIFAGIIFSFLAGILFVQRGAHWWNALQFHYYTAIFLTVYTARFVYAYVVRNIKINPGGKILIIAVICLLSVPNAVEKMIEFRKTSRHLVSGAELEALKKLSKSAEGTVFTVPLTPETAYVSAFSGKQVYFADEQMLQNNGIEYEERKKILQNPENIDLNSIDAKYVYLLKSDPLYSLFLDKARGTSYRLFFENIGVVIYSREL